jgi:RES domain-containing protein
MELWRISNYADLSGAGGLRAAGRWHSQGKRIVYLADHPSSALLEMLVHLDREFPKRTSCCGALGHQKMSLSS